MESKRSVVKDYFNMLMKAKLPYKLLVITLIISFIKAQLALIFADKLGSAIHEYANMNEAIMPLLVLFIIGMGSVIVAVVKTYVESIATAQVERNMQQYALAKVFYLKMNDLEEEDPRQLVTRLTEDTSKSGNFIIDLTVNELPRLYYIIAATFAVIKLKLPLLTITLLLVIPVIFLGAFISGKVTFKNREKVQSKIASLTALLAEKLDNMATIKSYSQEEEEIVKGNEVILQLDKAKR
ncbi:MAG: ABC transporter ATP-binding protein, partial [Erysipelotrichaceae bacterium]|nr:ABC transporter ATP-binding protein [Erysipelotrichaceae bacterium]